MSASNLVGTIGPVVVEDQEELDRSFSLRAHCLEHPGWATDWITAVDVDDFWDPQDRNDEPNQTLVRDTLLEYVGEHLEDQHGIELETLITS